MNDSSASHLCFGSSGEIIISDLVFLRAEIPLERYAPALAVSMSVSDTSIRPRNTVASFDTEHWLATEIAKEVNEALEKWIDGVELV